MGAVGPNTRPIWLNSSDYFASGDWGMTTFTNYGGGSDAYSTAVLTGSNDSK